MIAENIENVRRRVVSSCERSGRNPADVTLLAVTKTFPPGDVRSCLAAGLRDLGENYVQELVKKQAEIADPTARWHFIGHLQRNKVREIIALVHMIHSVDSIRLGEEISAQASRLGRTIDLLVEVNTSGEPTKFGVTPGATEGLVTRLKDLPAIRVVGFMTIGPFLPDPELSRPAFRILRQLQTDLRHDGFDLPHLSMGMSNDFEVAIEEGATMIRIGTLLFGKRATSRATG
jgi:pyridoxal phosphate enzyme (YggS family)